MEKRGQSGLIVAIVLIMVVLVSIIIVWNLVFGILNNSSSQTGIDQFSNTVTIESVKLLINGDLEVNVKKGSGDGTINSLKFNVFDSAGTAYSIALNNTNLNTLETKTYILNASIIKANNKLKSVSVYPALGNKIGMEAQAYDSALNKDSSGNLVPEIPSNPSSIGLISWWKFDGDYKDSVGSNHGNCSGTICPSLTIDNHGNANGAYLFNGLNNYVNISDSPSLNLNDTFTISMWIKPKNNLNVWERCIIDKITSPTYSGFAICFSNSQTMYWWRNNNAGVWGASFFNFAPISDIWYNLIFVYDRISHTTKFYQDGVLISTDPTGQPLRAAAPLRIGGYAYFNGTIDNIMIFNKSLNVDEVKAIYNNQK